MAKLAARGSGPVGFTTGDDATQYVIPLSWIAFEDGSVTLDAPAGAVAPELVALLESWLGVLASEGIIEPTPPDAPPTPAPPPPAVPAMVISAARPGPLGNDIVVTIQNVRETLDTPPRTVFDARVVQTEAHPGLQAADVVAALGSAAGDGLAFISSGAVADVPAVGTHAFTAAANPADPATVDIPAAAGGGAAFTLTTRAGGPEALATSATVDADPAVADHFDITLTWDRAAAGLEPADFGAEFDHVVTIASAPLPGGGAGALGVPAAGEYRLAGGAAAAAAGAAQAQLPPAS